MKDLFKNLIKEGSLIYKVAFWLVIISLAANVLIVAVAAVEMFRMGLEAGGLVLVARALIAIVINTVAASALARAAWPLDDEEEEVKTRSRYE